MRSQRVTPGKYFRISNIDFDLKTRKTFAHLLENDGKTPSKDPSLGVSDLFLLEVREECADSGKSAPAGNAMRLSDLLKNSRRNQWGEVDLKVPRVLR